MINSSTYFANASFPHLLSKLAMTVFGEEDEAMKVGLVDAFFVLLWE